MARVKAVKCGYAVCLLPMRPVISNPRDFLDLDRAGLFLHRHTVQHQAHEREDSGAQRLEMP